MTHSTQSHAQDVYGLYVHHETPLPSACRRCDDHLSATFTFVLAPAIPVVPPCLASLRPLAALSPASDRRRRGPALPLLVPVE